MGREGLEETCTESSNHHLFAFDKRTVRNRAPFFPVSPITAVLPQSLPRPPAPGLFRWFYICTSRSSDLSRRSDAYS